MTKKEKTKLQKLADQMSPQWKERDKTLLLQMASMNDLMNMQVKEGVHGGDDTIEFLEGIKFDLYAMSSLQHEVTKKIDFFIDKIQIRDSNAMTKEEYKEKYIDDLCDND